MSSIHQANSANSANSTNSANDSTDISITKRTLIKKSKINYIYAVNITDAAAKLVAVKDAVAVDFIADANFETLMIDVFWLRNDL